MSYSLKKQAAESKARKFLFIVLGLSLILGITFLVISPPSLDDNFCPVDRSKIKRHRFSMLIDITSDLTNQNKKIVNALVADWTSNGIPSQMLSIYSLNTSNIREFEDIDTICTPPNALILGFTYGQQRANQRISQFKARIQDVVNQASLPTHGKLTSSKILESLRQITNGPSWISGSSRLILISDLIEKSEFADFYNSNVPTFSNWLEKKSNKGLVDSIQLSRGDKVQICQLLTEKPSYESRERAKQFWIDLIAYKGITEVFFTCNGIVRD
jgi:hypothetical protein